MNPVRALQALSLAVAGLFAFSLQAASATGYPGGHSEALGPLYQAQSSSVRSAVAHARAPQSALAHWNIIAVDASGLDHTPLAPGEQRVFGEQFGPTRASRAMAIVHIAMFEAVNAVAPRYKSYAGVTPIPRASMEAAMAQAARDTLVAMFPSQSATFEQHLVDELAAVRARVPREAGIELGHRAAAAILALRADDGSDVAEPRLGVNFFTSDGPGNWRQDPIGRQPIAMGARWSDVQPFVLTSASQFRIPPPPTLDSVDYATAFNEAKAYGGDGIVTPTIRSAEQTDVGTYWAYDGTPSLCAPPRLYNQIAMQIAAQLHTDTVDLARLLALVNTAMADAGIAAWESKYFYNFWRPVTAIREADPGTGPTGLGDFNPLTVGDLTFTPLGAPASNLTGPNFTPPFPAYPSGHATFGGALFQTLRRFYGRDDIGFTFVSDELNGVTRDHDGNVRPLVPRSFQSFSQAEEENGQSRIYLGIHWSFDKSEGIALGRQVADEVFDNAFQPRR
jgi:hypothetical protein